MPGFSSKRRIELTQAFIYAPSSRSFVQPARGAPPRPLALALLTVALPRARPTPLPFTPLLLNMGAFL